MGIDTVTAFVDAVRQSRLLEPDLLDRLAERAPESFTDPRTLARHLIQKGRLTAYQVNQLFQGQGSTLVLGNYVLLERLGEGGMGQVFKARHRTMGRIVALKVIRRDRLENADAVKRFRREIQAVSQLHHPNVVIAYDADAVGNTHFFVMEYVDGIDLSQLVKQKGALPVGRACDFIRQAALGLEHAHQKGLVHRDIKPSNLLVTGIESASPVVKILDMGLARLAPQEVEDSSGGSLSQDGSVMGTPDFMAPEQAKNSSKVDGRADIYSLGCTLYYLLSGQVPFAGGSSIEKLLKHQMDAPRPIEELRADVPAPIRALLTRMLAKRPEDRVQTANEVAMALTPFCGGNGIYVGEAAGGEAAATLPLAAPVTDKAPVPRLTGRMPALPDNFRRFAQHQRRGLVLAAVGVLFLGMIWLTAKALRSTSASDKSQSTAAAVAGPSTTGPRKLPNEPGHKYLPDDTGTAVVINLPQLLRSPVVKGAVRERMEDSLNNMKLALGGWGVNLFEDVQRVIMASSPAVPVDKNCMVFYGHFSPEKVRAAVSRGQYKHRDVPGIAAARIYEVYDRSAGRSLYFALVNPNVFVSCSDPDHLANCFRRSAGSPVPNLSDDPVQKLLQNLDARPTIYGVIGRSSLLKPGQGHSPARDLPVASIHGGLRFQDDVTAEVVVTASQPGTIDQLRRFIKALLWDERVASDTLRPIFPLLATVEPQVNPREMTVTIRRTFAAGEIQQLAEGKGR